MSIKIEYWLDHMIVQAGDEPAVRLTTDAELKAFREAHPEDARYERGAIMYALRAKDFEEYYLAEEVRRRLNDGDGA